MQSNHWSWSCVGRHDKSSPSSKEANVFFGSAPFWSCVVQSFWINLIDLTSTNLSYDFSSLPTQSIVVVREEMWKILGNLSAANYQFIHDTHRLWQGATENDSSPRRTEDYRNKSLQFVCISSLLFSVDETQFTECVVSPCPSERWFSCRIICKYQTWKTDNSSRLFPIPHPTQWWIISIWNFVVMHEVFSTFPTKDEGRKTIMYPFFLPF